MVTKEQALIADTFHWVGSGQCRRTIGPRGGVTYSIIEYRRSGKTKTWKTRPHEFRVPIKYGLYESSFITHMNANQYHVATECPLLYQKDTA